MDCGVLEIPLSPPHIYHRHVGLANVCVVCPTLCMFWRCKFRCSGLPGKYFSPLSIFTVFLRLSIVMAKGSSAREPRGSLHGPGTLSPVHTSSGKSWEAKATIRKAVNSILLWEVVGEGTDHLQAVRKPTIRVPCMNLTICRRSGNRNRLTPIKLLFPEAMNGIREQAVAKSFWPHHEEKSRLSACSLPLCSQV